MCYKNLYRNLNFMRDSKDLVLILTLYRNRYYFPSRLNEETEIEDNSKENPLFFHRIKSK